MRIVVTAHGLGAALVRELALVGHSVTALSHSDLDITDALRVQAVSPTVAARGNPQLQRVQRRRCCAVESSYSLGIDARGPAALAGAAANAGAVLVYSARISSSTANPQCHTWRNHSLVR